MPSVRSRDSTTYSQLAWEGVFFLALTVILSWPLAAQLPRALPGDYGDPLFVSWVMGWVMKQLTAMLTGHTEAIAGFWHAPIFFPERNTLALSEHFTAQAVEALPVWWLTGNLLLCYSIVTILSFVLTALGTSALVRDLSGSRLAGVVAGMMAAFNPYRLVLELGHLHVLSIQWLPFALLGLHRFVRSGSRGWLAVGAGSIIALNLSSGYYMLYAGPVIVLFTLADMFMHRKLADRGVWFGLIVSAVCVALVTTPFVIPYLNMQRQHAFERPLQEVIAYSASIDQYAFGLPWIGMMIVGAAGILLDRGRDTGRAYAWLFLAFALLAFWLSLGPVVRSGGQPINVPSAYLVLYQWVPGFRGLRVASRYAAVMLVCLPIAAGLGLAAFSRARPRAATVTVVGVAVVFLWLVWPARFPVNEPLVSAKLQPPPAYLTPSPQLPAIYRAVAGLDGSAVIAEFPFGDPWYELRYMFFAIGHDKRLMNGYSGVFPATYAARRDRLGDPLVAPRRAGEALAGATHVIVHERAWADDTGARIEAWLEELGGVIVADVDGAKLIALESLRREARLVPACDEGVARCP